MTQEILEKLGAYLDVFKEENITWESSGQKIKLGIGVPVKLQQLIEISEIVEKKLNEIAISSIWSEDREQSYLVLCWSYSK